MVIGRGALPSPQPLSRREKGYNPSPCGRRWREAPDEGTGAASCTKKRVAGTGRAVGGQLNWHRASLRTLTPTPAPRPGPRLRRGRSKARAPMTRKLCLVAPAGEGL
ncbi:hypothetical protein XhhCFBP4925_02125 [Xanthomonas hortorum pv. hederae]|nr:hypothetical protein XhhCFBP4925_02125 [Xanthomonas hortorum pv. hederae]